jgi:hypothetical protein
VAGQRCQGWPIVQAVGLLIKAAWIVPIVVYVFVPCSTVTMNQEAMKANLRIYPRPPKRPKQGRRRVPRESEQLSERVSDRAYQISPFVIIDNPEHIQ